MLRYSAIYTSILWQPKQHQEEALQTIKNNDDLIITTYEKNIEPVII